MFAVHTDMLVLGIGATEAEALVDAGLHGSEDESLLETVWIEPHVADYIRAGGDCRGLFLAPFFADLEQICLRKGAWHA